MVKILIIGIVLFVAGAAAINEALEIGYGRGFMDGVIESERMREKEKKDGEKDKDKSVRQDS